MLLDQGLASLNVVWVLQKQLRLETLGNHVTLHSLLNIHFGVDAPLTPDIDMSFFSYLWLVHARVLREEVRRAQVYEHIFAE